MRLSRALADALIEHARADMPNECCGLIAGRDGEATRIIPMRNTEATPFMYVMDPREQMEQMDAIEDAGEDLVAIYHSHTRSAAYPSRTDVDLAFFPHPVYVIVSLADRDAPEIRGFHLARTAPEGEQIHEVPLRIA